MNQTIIVDAGARASELEVFIQQHPVIALLIGVVVCGWLVTGIVNLWLPSTKNVVRILMTADAGIAAALTAVIFHAQFSWPVLLLLCLLCGAGSPFAYRLLANLACRWKPDLRKFLVLPELAPETTTNENDQEH